MNGINEALIKAKVAQLATLPEHEWREAIATLVYKLEATNDIQTDMISTIEETVNKRFGEVEKTNKEVLEILNGIKGGLTFFKWMGIFLKWCTIVIGCFTAIAGAIVAGDKALDVVKAAAKIKSGS